MIADSSLFLSLLQDHAEMHGGTIPEPNELQDKKTQLEADLDGLGGEDPAVIQKYERAKAEVRRIHLLSSWLRRNAQLGRDRC